MPHTNVVGYEFGPFKLHVDQRLLTREGIAVSLTPKATDILLVLLKNAGEVVTKEALMSEVWPDSFVEEANLTQNIFKLRQALGDQKSEAHYIETIAKRGYRFVAPVDAGLSLASNIASIERTGKFLHRDRRPRLAVLPFINRTGDSSFEYLAEGISDSVINSLSQISKLRVMSRSAMFRFREHKLEPKLLAQKLEVDAIVFGGISLVSSALALSVELVDGMTGWQLWGNRFDFELGEIAEIQHEVVRQISQSLELRLTGDEEKIIAARYTDNALAYKEYLEGRFHWSHYTREAVEQAVGHFSKAIEYDPNYALAYSAAIDCHLRLASNYLLPQQGLTIEETKVQRSDVESTRTILELDSQDLKVTLRNEWDWKGAQRELRRASDLRAHYPAAHQWHAAFKFVCRLSQHRPEGTSKTRGTYTDSIPTQFRSAVLTESEEIQVFCTIAREQIVIGNFEGARLILERWLPQSGWPDLSHLDPHVAADLLLTLGSLIAALSLTGHITKGNKRAEAYLSGAIALFEHLGRKTPAAEAKIELARCFYREGLFDDAREILTLALSELAPDQKELISLCLSICGCVERDAGRLQDSLERLTAASMIETGQLVTGFRHLQMATTLKELGNTEAGSSYYEEAKQHFQQALYEFEAIGNHRNCAATANNFGYLLLSLGMFKESEENLLRALRLFNNFSDLVRAAQVNETLTQLYLALGDFRRARLSIERAVATLERTDGAALLAEALTTQGVVACRLKRFDEARKCFEGSYRVAEQCGDHFGAGRALLKLYDEMSGLLKEYEKLELKARLKRLTSQAQQSSLLGRMENVLQKLSRNEKSISSEARSD